MDDECCTIFYGTRIGEEGRCILLHGKLKAEGILVSFLKIVLVYCSLVYKWNYNGGQKEVYRMRRKFTKFLYLTRTTNKQNKRML